jgi:hypothetical protein
MVEVDWSTLFKYFYEIARIKVACKDVRKIPQERLYEMNKKLYVISFMVEGEVNACHAKMRTREMMEVIRQ